MARRRRRLRPSIIEVVKREMRLQGVTQGDIARHCVVATSQLSPWLRGKRGLRQETIESVLAYLGIRLMGPGE